MLSLLTFVIRAAITSGVSGSSVIIHLIAVSMEAVAWYQVMNSISRESGVPPRSCLCHSMS